MIDDPRIGVSIRGLLHEVVMSERKSFVDGAGRTWVLNLTIAAMRRAKVQGVDLSQSMIGLEAVMDDETQLATALYAIVQPDAEKLSITSEQFDAGLINGEVIGAAQDALWEALHDFFPPSRRPMLAAARISKAMAIEEATASMSGPPSTVPRESSATQ